MRQKRRTSTSVLYYLLAGVLALIFLLPFLIMVFGSLDAETKYSITLTNWFPSEFSLRTYQNVLSLGSDMSRWFPDMRAAQRRILPPSMLRDTSASCAM